MGKIEYVFDRRGFNSAKWDEEVIHKDLIPLSIADMEFKCPIEIRNALSNIIDMGAYGYTYRSEQYYKSIIEWLKRRHDLDISKENILPGFGVMFSISACIKALSSEGDNILINIPSYYPFFSVIRDNNRNLLESPLILNEVTMQYEIDFQDLEEKLKNSKIFLFSSPHNPTGRVWSEEELKKIAILCRQYNILIISDEIHSDLLLSNSKHIPFVKICNQESVKLVTCSSASKTFNLAGFNISYSYINDLTLKEKIEKEIYKTGLYHNNIAGLVATEYSYNECEYWLNDLLDYLKENKNLVCMKLGKYKDKIRVIDSQGTYLMLIQFIGYNSTDIMNELKEKLKILVEDGSMFKCEEGFVRVNIACPREVLSDVLDKVEKIL